MAFSLLECCVTQVYRNIVGGKTRHVDYKLNLDLSKILFEVLSSEIDPDIAREIGSKFNLTDVIVDQDDPHEEYIEMIRSQKGITSLVLPDLICQKTFHTDYSNKDTEMEVPIVDIIKVLNRLLSEESRETLKVLTIKGWQPFFCEGWIPQIPILLPALTSLCLFGIYIDEDMIPLIWKHLTQLIDLSIGDNGAKNLMGISSMKNLERLKLLNSSFKNKEDIMEIFEMEKLSFLSFEREIFWTNELSVSATKLLAQCKKVLPALVFLDCMGNDISEETISEIANSHPHLKEICVMDTAIEEIAEIRTENREGLQLISTGSLGNCVRFLQYHQQKGESIRAPEVLRTLRAILNQLQEHFDDQLEVEKTLCAEAVSEFLSDRDLDVNQTVVTILSLLARNSGLQELSENTIRELIFNLLWCDQKGEWIVHKCATQQQYEAMTAQCHHDIWSLLVNISALKLSQNNAETLVEDTLNALDVWTRPGHRQFEFYLFALVLKNGLRQFTKPYQSVNNFKWFFSWAISYMEERQIPSNVFFDCAMIGCELMGQSAHIDEMHIRFIMTIGYNYFEKCSPENAKELLKYIEQIAIKFGDSLSRPIRNKMESPEFISLMFRRFARPIAARQAKMSFVFTVLHFSKITKLLPIDRARKIREIHVNRAVSTNFNSSYEELIRDMLDFIIAIC